MTRPRPVESATPAHARVNVEERLRHARGLIDLAAYVAESQTWRSTERRLDDDEHAGLSYLLLAVASSIDAAQAALPPASLDLVAPALGASADVA